MKSALFLPAFTILLGAATAQAASFSVTAWSSELESALDDGDVKDAEKMLIFDRIETEFLSRQKTDSREALAKARKLYAAGKLDEAIVQYDRVAKGAPEWLEAVEERGWAYLRKGDVEKAIAQTKTLISPQFRSVVGSEPFFLQSLAMMKVCDYEGALKTNQAFKETQRPRLIAIQSLADKGTSEAAQAVERRADRFPLTVTTMGTDASLLPRQVYRDLAFQKSLLRIKASQKALDLLRSAKQPKSAAFAAKAIPRLENELKASREALKGRLSKLAKAEAEENFDLVQKLNLVEVEIIERVHSDADMDRANGDADFVGIDRDQLMFVDDGNPWIDELDHYQVRLNACAQNVRRKM